MIPPPDGKRVRSATPAIHRKREQEHADLRASIQRRWDEVVPFHEILGPVLAQVVLADDADDVVGPDGRVNADEEVAHVPEDNGRVEVGPDALGGEEAVQEVEGHGGEEAEEVGDCYPVSEGWLC